MFTSVPCSSEGLVAIEPFGSQVSSEVAFSIVKSVPIRENTSRNPVRVGLRLTLSMVTERPVPPRAAKAMMNAADETSPGTEKSRGATISGGLLSST